MITNVEVEKKNKQTKKNQNKDKQTKRRKNIYAKPLND